MRALSEKKTTLNKCVFKCFSKVAGPTVRSLNSTGNSFQQLGPATAKALNLTKLIITVSTHSCYMLGHCHVFIQYHPQLRTTFTRVIGLPNNAMYFGRKVGFLLLLCSQINSVFKGLSLRTVGRHPTTHRFGTIPKKLQNNLFLPIKKVTIYLQVIGKDMR